MTAPYYLLAPFERHFDGGFGATADAFEQAAKALDGQGDGSISNPHLPLQFLYRHAIELYFKSIIIVLSKRLSIMTPGMLPLINTRDGQKPMYRVHNIGDLYRHFESLLSGNWEALRTMCETDWMKMPPELAGWISIIEGCDPKSTLHRYPSAPQSGVEQDKALFQAVSLEEIKARVQAETPSGVGLFLLDDGNEVVEAFMTQGAPLQELGVALKGAARLLSGAHMGIRMEFAGGW